MSWSNRKQATKGWLYALFSAALVSCNSGGDTTSSGDGVVTGLEMASTMSVVTAQSNNGSSLRHMHARAVADPLPSGEFATDRQNVYVFDESMESLQTVNMILCLMDQTKASSMVNQGAYIALVDEDKCEQGQNQSSAGATGQSSGGQSTTYNKWTIVSERASATAPQIVKIWIPGEAGGDPREGQDMLVEVTVNEGVSGSKPFGSFVLNFKGVIDSGVLQGGAASGNYLDMMKGSLQTVDNADGKPQFKFINVAGTENGFQQMDFGFREAANVILDNASGTSGRARALRSETGDFDGPGPNGVTTNTASYTLDLNADYVMRAKDNNADNVADAQRCLSRTSFNAQVWRYNLYNPTTGARVTRNSGFPFTYNGKYGHVGYWGVWYEDGNLPDGATIAKVDFATNTTTDYTVRVSPGKLVRRTANTVNISELRGAELYFWGNVGGNFGQYLVTVNNSDHFIATDSVAWGESGRTTTNINDTDITPNANVMLSLWSDALGGNLTYIGGATTVVFYAQEFVQPNDAVFASSPVTLNCYQRCVKGGLTQAAINAAGGNPNVLYHADKNNPGDTPYAYLADVVNGKLRVRDHLGAEVKADTLNLASLGNDWGVNTGEMITSTVNNPWEVFSQPVSYRWETGSNNWNKLISVQKASDSSYAVFDRPLNFTYTFSAGDNRNPTDTSQHGKKFMLQYGGPGELHGFPWAQDPNNPQRWRSSVTLKDGVILNDGSNNYLVKAIELEQSMLLSNTGNAADVSACTGASLNASSLFSNANLGLPTTSDIGTISFTWPGKPTVTAAPAVIGGVLQ